MSTKIYKLCLIKGYTEAYYQLSEEEKTKYWERIVKIITEKAGAKMATPAYDCRWSNDKYASFFIIEYPSVESAIIDTTSVEEAELFRYTISETIMGIAEGEGATISSS